MTTSPRLSATADHSDLSGSGPRTAFSIESLRASHIQEVSAVHARALNGDFLPSLGEPFLRELYSGVVELGLGFGFVAIEDERVRGFVVGCRDSSSLFSKLLRGRLFRLGWALLRGIRRHPGLIFNALETALYPSKERLRDTKAELVVIALADGWQGRGMGSGLVKRFEQELQAMRVSHYKVTVHSEKVESNRFYQKLGFVGRGHFRLHGKGWNVYVRNLHGDVGDVQSRIES